MIVRLASTAVRSRMVVPIVVWGETYLRTFLDLALPSFLAAENLPRCSKTADIHLNIVTTPEDARRLQALPIIAFTRQYATVEIVPSITDGVLAGCNKYGVMAQGHHQIIKKHDDTDVIITTLSPDCVVSENTLSRSLEHILGGYRAVLVAGPRAGLQRVRAAVEAVDGGDNFQLALAPRRLVSVLMNNFHPISKSVFADARRFSTFPSCIYWNVSPCEFIARYFHLHPLMVRLSGKQRLPEKHTGTVDATLLEDTGISFDDMYVACDSDDLLIVELSDEGMGDGGSARALLRTYGIYQWAKQWTTPRHRRFFANNILRFRGEGADNDAGFNRSAARMRRDTMLLTFLLGRLDKGSRHQGSIFEQSIDST